MYSARCPGAWDGRLACSATASLLRAKKSEVLLTAQVSECQAAAAAAGLVNPRTAELEVNNEQQQDDGDAGSVDPFSVERH